MNTCSVCFKPFTPTIDRLLYEGIPVAEIARRTGQSRQVIGRHKRNRHAIRHADPATLAAEPEPVFDDALDDLAVAAATAAIEVLVGHDPDAVAAAEAHPNFDWLIDRVLEYRKATVAAG